MWKTHEDNEMKIDTGIPLPSDLRGKTKYRFAEMKVNDSAFFTGVSGRFACDSAPYQAATVFGKKNNMKFIGRKEGDGVRIWRIA